MPETLDSPGRTGARRLGDRATERGTRLCALEAHARQVAEAVADLRFAVGNSARGAEGVTELTEPPPSEHVGGTAANVKQHVATSFDEAKGGVVLVDAGMLLPKDESHPFDLEREMTLKHELLQRMSESGGTAVAIVGTAQQLQRLNQSDAGFERRLPVNL